MAANKFRRATWQEKKEFGIAWFRLWSGAVEIFGANSVSFHFRAARPKNEAAERNAKYLDQKNFVHKARRNHDQRGRIPARAVTRKFVLGST